MHFDPEHWKAAFFGLGIVRDPETGEIRWPVVAGGILVAGTVSVGGIIISMGNLISAIEARQQMVIARLEAIEVSAHPATSKRYNSDDATRDAELMRNRIRDSRDEARRDHDDNKQRIQRLESKLGR